MRISLWWAENSIINWDLSSRFSKIKEVITISIMRIQIPSFSYLDRALPETTEGKSGGKEAPVNCSRFPIPFPGHSTALRALGIVREREDGLYFLASF